LKGLVAFKKLLKLGVVSPLFWLSSQWCVAFGLPKNKLFECTISLFEKP
jgi:hypothetical protein